MKFIGTKAECEAVVAAIDKLHGYPRKGVNVGGGIHVEIPETYYPGAPGWTATHDVPDEDFQKTRGFAVDLAGLDSLEKFDTSKLDAKELQDLEAVATKLEAAVTKLPDDWHPDPTVVVEEPPKEEEPPKDAQSVDPKGVVLEPK